jgi:hypothetical protein
VATNPYIDLCGICGERSDTEADFSHNAYYYYAIIISMVRAHLPPLTGDAISTKLKNKRVSNSFVFLLWETAADTSTTT